MYRILTYYANASLLYRSPFYAGVNDDPRLYVGNAKQVTLLEVDEYGVKAAAVSGISIMPMSIPPVPILVAVDQPFYCAIYDSELKMPLFIARVVDPR